MSPAQPASSAPAPIRVLLFSRSLTQPAVIDALNASLGAARGIDYKVVTNGEELISYVVGGDSVIVVANCLLKEDIADLYNALPLLSHRCSDETLHILVLNSLRHPRLGALLRERGPIDLIELPVTLESLQYKIKEALDRLHEVWRKNMGQALGVDVPEHRPPDWNDLRGVAPADPDLPAASGPARGVLTPDARHGKTTGLRKIDAAGVAAGEQSFEKIQLSAEALMICGEKLAKPQEIFVYDLTEQGATLIVPREVQGKSDRVQLAIRLEAGKTRHSCTMLWEFKASDLDMGPKRLASGRFCGGDQAALSTLVHQLQVRRKELKDFFVSAKG